MQQNTNADLEQQFQACRAELAELTRAVQTERMARQQAEEALREQETTNILESIPDGFYALDHNWRFIYVNLQAELLLQKPRDQLLGQNIWEVYPEVVGTTFYHNYHEAMTQNISYHSEEFCSSLNSWFEVHAYPAKNGLSVYLQPISDRKQAEEALYRREQEFRALAENSPDIIARIDRQMRHLYVNAAVEAVTGISPQDFIGKTNQDLGMPRVQCADWEEKSQQVFATRQEQIIEFDFIRPDGTTRYYQTRIMPEFAKDGSVESILTIAREVTEFKQTEAALKESEQKYRNLVETSQGVIWSVNTEGYLSFVNPAVRQIYGYEPEEIIGRHFSELLTPEQA